MLLDNSFSENGKTVIVELKNYISGASLEGESLAQLYRYKTVLSQNIDKFSRIEYVFTTLEAAQNNMANLNLILRDKVSIYFVNTNGFKQLLTKAK